MLQRKIGNTMVGAIGYGAMVLEGYYGSSDDTNAALVLNQALDSGVTMIDTADAYGNGHNEKLIAQALKSRRHEAFIASKFGITFEEEYSGTNLPTGWGFGLNINGSPQYALYALEQTLHRLETDYLDLWYLHYPESGRPIDETITAMATQVKAGKVKYLGLSNVSADEIRRAHQVHPIAAVQYEYSLWRREIEHEILPTCKELGIAVVPWSPLGSGFLTGTIDKLSNDDFRNNNPKFSGNNLQENIDRFAPLKKIAGELNITPAQLALAWLLHQGEDIIPIPGTRTPARVIENAAAADIKLSAEVLTTINQIAALGAAKGATLV